jgi:uncharacterized membrane protein
MARRDLLDLLVLGAIWGAAFLFIRVAVPEFGPVALVEVRVIIAAALLMGLVVIRGQLGAFRGRWGALTLIGALNTAVPFALFAYATQTVPAGFAAVLNSTTPLFGALLGGAFFGERLGFTRALGLGIGFAGVVVLVARDLALVGGPPASGAALLGALLYAISGRVQQCPRLFALILESQAQRLLRFLENGCNGHGTSFRVACRPLARLKRGRTLGLRTRVRWALPFPRTGRALLRAAAKYLAAAAPPSSGPASSTP